MIFEPQLYWHFDWISVKCLTSVNIREMQIRITISLHIHSVQLLNHVQLFETPWTTARQASLSITNSRSPPKPMSIESVMPTISFSVVPFSSCPQCFPASGSFQMSQLFASGGQNIGVSWVYVWPPPKTCRSLLCYTTRYFQGLCLCLSSKHCLL